MRIVASRLALFFLMVAHSHAQYLGQVGFHTKVGSRVDAPVFLPDGRGAGYVPGMVAQLFRVDGDVRVPLEPQASFRSPSPVPEAAAYVAAPDGPAPTVGLPPGSAVTIAFRAWEGTKGATYEEARDRGGYYGESSVQMILNDVFNGPNLLLGLAGFILSKRQVLTFDGVNSDGITVHLESASVVTYRLETSDDLIHWTQFGIIKASSSIPITLPVVGEGVRYFRAVLQE
jgi:hypothetical protein